MKIRTKITLSSLFFLAVSSGVGAWCYLNIQKEERAFDDSRRAARTRAAVADIDYFATRRVRALQNYVLLNDEAEKLQFQQAGTQVLQRLALWRKSAAHRETNDADLPAVSAAFDALSGPAEKVETAMDKGRRTEAMSLVESEFVPASAGALKAIADIKNRTEASALQSEQDMTAELRRNHWSLLAGMGLVVFFGLVFLVSFYRSVIQPIHLMKSWADRVAQGERNVPWRFPGKNELTELATSLGEMAIQLTRPRAAPPAAVAAAASVAPAARVWPSPTETAGKTPPPVPSDPPVAPATPAPVKAPPPAAPKVKPEEFEDAVEGFREILAQMAGQTVPKSQKLG